MYNLTSKVQTKRPRRRGDSLLRTTKTQFLIFDLPTVSFCSDFRVFFLSTHTLVITLLGYWGEKGKVQETTALYKQYVLATSVDLINKPVKKF